MHPRLIVIGSLNADFVLQVGRFPVPGETILGQHFEVVPGGKGANQAFAAARLGASVSLIGQVGPDAHGEWLKNNLAAAGVDVTHVRRDPNASTGVAMITIDAAGQNQIIVVPGANGVFGVSELERAGELFHSARIVLLQLEIPLATVEAAVRLARDAGARIILDPAPAQKLSDAFLASVDYLTPNESELALLAGASPGELTRARAAELARHLLARGAKRVLVKMGSQGALLAGGDVEHFWPARKVNAVDTTAAGDAFNAAFACALVEGKSEFDAGRFATAAATCSVMRPGAQPSMPARSEVEALIN